VLTAVENSGNLADRCWRTCPLDWVKSADYRL